MKPLIKILLFLFIGIQNGLSQDSVSILSLKSFDKAQLRRFEDRRLILLSSIDGWVFRKGNDTLWAGKELNTSGWTKLKPTELSGKYSDESGKAEGWFRIKLRLDNDLGKLNFGFRRGGWAATDIYVDGNLIAAFGNTGVNGEDFTEYNPIDKVSVPVQLEAGKEYSIAMHFVDYVSFLPPFKLKSASEGGARLETSGLTFLLMLAGNEYDLFTTKNSVKTLFYRSVWLSVTLLLSLLFWLLIFMNPNEKKTLVPIALYFSFSAISNLNRFFLTDREISFDAWRLNDLSQVLCVWLVLVFSFIIITTILNFKLSAKFRYFLLAYYFAGGVAVVFDLLPPFVAINTLILFLTVTFMIISSWKKLTGAQWAIAAGVELSVVTGAILGISVFTFNTSTRFFLLTCFYFSSSLLLVLYVSLRFREIIKEVQENAKQVVKLSEEKKEQALNQQASLEQQVKERTAELSQSLENLKTAQKQLIQSEKMASLGELTAGIAHEIQNPLNFVNNFSEVNKELVAELNNEIEKGNYDDAKAIAKDITVNQEKINHHGRRADAIVKGMLQHSRSSSGIKESTDINALADEYLRFAYHGLRANDKTFNALTKTDFDSSIGKINVVPQEIGRVVLNLLNNAFYAVSAKASDYAKASSDELATAVSSYEPRVIVSTKKTGNKIEIIVQDNGNGIPQNIVDKIFQPFFTTKPTGQGTGLGLSLAYDIVKAHGGEIIVETKEGEGSEFIIQLKCGN